MTCFAYFDRPSTLFAGGVDAVPVHGLTPDDLAAAAAGPGAAALARAVGFEARPGEVVVVPGEAGKPLAAFLGLGARPAEAALAAGTLATRLPAGAWTLAGGALDPRAAALGFALGGYRFERFRASDRPQPVMTLPDGCDGADIERQVAGVYLARDLVNMPTNHMGPDALEDAFRRLAAHYSATVSVTAREALIEANLPMIHAVGRASAEAPRLLDMRWGRKGAPKVTLVGKGVCFDTGGLDIKPAASMLLMKKDMGGAANVMGLALMVMDAGLDVELRVLVPAVENSISGNAFRPGDILTSRKGLTVQIDNTDAEGRLVLADALTLAGEEEPELIVDMATLTGAARVALGPDLPPFYTHDDSLAGDLAEAALKEHDPLWRMPLYKPYDKDVSARIADITNAPAGGFAGSITAALFLNRFVAAETPWIHLDIDAWNPKDKPHAPMGGEAQGIRALYAMLRKRYG
ncbi:MAG: leucyl aminopeptidase family protein [Pararhizobium sp.]